jgi:carbamoyltransferase
VAQFIGATLFFRIFNIMSQIIVSISSTGHDRCIAVMEDYKLKAIFQEDRFSRVKNDVRDYMISIEQLPKNINKIDYLILSGIEPHKLELYIDWLNKHNLNPKNIIRSPISEHHLYHSSSAFFGSGFKEAICLTIDAWGGLTLLPGYGEERTGRYTTKIFLANYPSNFREKYANVWFDSFCLDNFNPNLVKNTYDYNDNLDIGFMYSTISEFIGFPKAGDEGKVMGLSAYGKENIHLPSLLYKDTLYGNSNVFSNSGKIKTKLNPELQNLTQSKVMDLAFSIQKSLEKVILERIKQAISYSNTKNLVLSGGCFMNVVCNYLIKKHFPKLNIYVDPMATDSGLAYGAAKYYYYQATGSNKLDPLNHLYWGPRYSKKTLLNSIQKYV